MRGYSVFFILFSTIFLFGSSAVQADRLIRDEVRQISRRITNLKRANWIETPEYFTLTSYLKTLTEAQSILPLPFEAVSLSEAVQEKLYLVSQRAKSIVPPEIPSGLLYFLFNEIERTKTSVAIGSQKDLAVSYSLTSRRVDASIHFTPDGKIYFSFEPSFIARGASKVVSEWFDYDHLTPVAQVHFINSGGFKNEKLVLQLISSFSEENKIGLVEPISFLPNDVLLKKYDSTLANAIYRYNSLSKLTRVERLQLTEQLSRGLYILHGQGIYHSDLKPENILVKFDAEDPDKIAHLAISDFDLSIDYYQEFAGKSPISSTLGRRRPVSGTIGWIPPEVSKFLNELIKFPMTSSLGWSGETAQERILNTLKADVFALGTLAMEIYRPESATWFSACFREYQHSKESEPQKLIRFEVCQTKALDQYFEDSRDLDHYYPFRHLISAAIHPDPEKRINSKQFLLGIQHLIRRETREDAPFNKISLKEFSDLYGKDYRTVRSGYRQAVSTALLYNPPGSFVLSPEGPPENCRIRLTWIDPDHRVQSMELDVDPSETSWVAEEIQFLRQIGILS